MQVLIEYLLLQLNQINLINTGVKLSFIKIEIQQQKKSIFTKTVSRRTSVWLNMVLTVCQICFPLLLGCVAIEAKLEGFKIEKITLGCFHIPPQETKGRQLNGEESEFRPLIPARPLKGRPSNQPDSKFTPLVNSKSVGTLRISQISQNTNIDQKLRYIPRINNN